MTTSVRRLAGQAMRTLAAWPIASRAYCCICKASVGMFLPYTPSGLRPFREPPLMSALELVGSELRRFSCPRCLSHDRERHMFLYLKATGMLERLSDLRILHMAPERNLAPIIARKGPTRYVKGDLFPSTSDIERIDLERIPYPDESFDLVIANHVLEHVADDRAALGEIARVLAAGGRAILQTPFSPVLERTFEDPGVCTPRARLQAFGQEDHVRLYGRDIFQRFASAGLTDRSIRHTEILAGTDANRFGVNVREPFFLFEKAATSARAGEGP